MLFFPWNKAQLLTMAFRTLLMVPFTPSDLTSTLLLPGHSATFSSLLWDQHPHPRTAGFAGGSALCCEHSSLGRLLTPSSPASFTPLCPDCPGYRLYPASPLHGWGPQSPLRCPAFSCFHLTRDPPLSTDVPICVIYCYLSPPVGCELTRSWCSVNIC